MTTIISTPFYKGQNNSFFNLSQFRFFTCIYEYKQKMISRTDSERFVNIFDSYHLVYNFNSIRRKKKNEGETLIVKTRH